MKAKPLRTVLLAGSGLMSTALAQQPRKPLDLSLPSTFAASSTPTAQRVSPDPDSGKSASSAQADVHDFPDANSPRHGFRVGKPQVRGEVGTGFISQSYFGTGEYVDGVFTADQALGRCGHPSAMIGVTIHSITRSGFGSFYVGVGRRGFHAGRVSSVCGLRNSGG